MAKSKINRVYMDAKDKNVATVLVFVNDNDELFYDKEFTVAVPEEDIKELYFKGSIFVKNERYYSPYNYDPVTNTIAWKPSSSGGGLDGQVQTDWNQTDGTAVDYIKNKPSLSTVATTGDYSDLSNTPELTDVALSGDYSDLSNTPEFSSVALSGSYSDLSNTPNLATVATSGSYSDLSNKPSIPAAQIPADWEQGNHLAPDYIKNKPTIPEAYVLPPASTETLGGVKVDGTTITIDNNGVISGTDIVQVPADWNQSDTDAVDYIKNKPTIPAAQIPSDWNQSDTEAVDYIKNKPTIPAAQVQVDWSQGNHNAVDYIKNKPNLATVATTGDYSDLTNKPTIPTQARPDWNESDSESLNYISNKPNLATVATSGLYSDLSGTPSLATVATSGSYDDLSNKPNIPAAQVQSDWNQGNHQALDYIKNKPSLATVATTGSYDDLLNKPAGYSLPTASTDTLGGVKVDNETITINNGVISSAQYSLPTASAETLGGVMVDGESISIVDGIISANFPEIPQQEQADWGENDSSDISYIKNKPSLATVATSGSYNDLTNKPNIDGSITVSGNPIAIDASDIYIDKAIASFEPVQDLNGYDYPWVGGAGKNIFDFESWLTARGVTYTKTGNAYTFNVSSLVGSIGTWTFSDTPINVTLTANITNDTSTNVGFRLKNDADVSSRGDNITMTATTVYLDWSTTGQVTIEEPMIRLASVTDDTYAPYSNICPISGYTECEVTRAGVNQWDEVVRFGYYDNAGEFISNATTIANSNSIKVVPNTTCYFALNARYKNGVKFIFRDISKNYITYDTSRGGVLTIPNNCYYIDFSTYGVTGITTYDNDISLNYPSTITSYEPYQGQTYTVEFKDSQDQPMTVYSGTLDVTTGVLTVDRKMVDMGDLSWSYSSTNAFFYTSTIADMKQVGVYGDNNIISSQYVWHGVGGSQLANGEMMCNSKILHVKDTRYTDATTFKTAMDGVQLLYELATPQVIQLNPTQIKALKGNNTILVNGKTISVTYQPNNVIGEAKEYTDKYINDVNNKLELEKEVTGASVSVTDSAECYLDELEVTLEPKQNLNGYSYPWVGGAGVNQWDEQVELGYYDSTGTFQSANNRLCTKNKIKVTPENTYYCKLPLSSSLTDNFIICYDTNEEFLQRLSLSNSGNGFSFTTPNNCYYINVNFTVSYTGGTTYNNDIAINYPSTVTTYSPYSNVCPITGYDECEVTRTGKNILPMTVDAIKEINTDGTWNGNTYTILSCTVTIMTDDGSNVTGFKINNAPSGNHANFYLASNITLSNDCVLSGGLGVSTVKLRVYSGTSVAYEDAGQGANVSAGSYTNVRIIINEGYNANNAIIYPMIRLATVTDASFESYQEHSITATFNDTIYSGNVNFATGTVTVDKAITRRTEFDYKSSSTYNHIYRLGTISKSDITNIANTITDKFKYKNIYAVNESGFYIGTGAASSLQNELWVGLTLESGVDTLAKANTWLANNGGYVDILYELATPQVIKLSPTQLQMLKGNNTIVTNGTTIRLKYQPENIIGEIKSYSTDILNRHMPETQFDGKTVLFMGDSFMEGFGQRVVDGLDSTSNPIITPENADSTPMRGWAKTFKELYPKANVHNLGIYGATIAYQDNSPSLMGELVYMFDQGLVPDYVIFDGGANDVFQGITKGSATAEDVFATMNWDTFNYNTYQTLPCLEAIFALFNERRPITRLLFVSPPPMALTVGSEVITAIESMKTDILAVCDKWGVMHTQMIGKGSKNTIYSSNTDYYSASDKIHPKQRYYDETIYQIIDMLKKM